MIEHTQAQQLCPGQFFGAVVKERTVADSILTEYSYAAETNIRQHSHPLAYFSIILQGTYAETHGNRMRHCRPSMLFFHPAGETHADRFGDGPCRIFSFELGTHWLNRAADCSLKLDRPIEFSSGAAVWLASRLYQEMYETDVASSLTVEGLLLEIVAETVRNTTGNGRQKVRRWLESAKEIITANFAESISIDEIAEAVGVHPIHLSREFRRHYQQTIGDFVRGLRIQSACHELMMTETPLLEIAVACGFADHAHFTRTFKRITGLTPSQYRATFASR
ncbi:MAG TPA: AraC family transcriptional regulator [Pyrinomonadaceae bacterium]|nr:AraC family transcriptional regulator [Pyrinomonadaceae bacterium]